jgi:hypothetical protein
MVTGSFLEFGFMVIDPFDLWFLFQPIRWAWFKTVENGSQGQVFIYSFLSISFPCLVPGQKKTQGNHPLGQINDTSRHRNVHHVNSGSSFLASWICIHQAFVWVRKWLVGMNVPQVSHGDDLVNDLPRLVFPVGDQPPGFQFLDPVLLPRGRIDFIFRAAWVLGNEAADGFQPGELLWFHGLAAPTFLGLPIFAGWSGSGIGKP